MASGRQVEYSLRLNSNASSVLNADAAAANKFDNSMSQVSNTLTRFGIVLGAHAMLEASKEWTQAAADYEVAMLRIKNASIEGMGAFNQQFINSQVDHFKLKLQESADAYGNFLFKIKNANLSNDVQNRLFENLNVVGKVGGIPQEQMDATVRNVGILLGEGVLEARHLRQLSYVHPQIVPFLADALGIKSGQKDEFSALFKTNIDDETAQQKFSQLISSGKLTKLGLNANIILEAFEKYRLSIESKLPETLDTVQSHLNSLSATWERFKNSLVLGQKPELLEFFQSLESSIHWLAEHEEGIIRTGKEILHLVEAYAAWRVAIMALHAPSAILGFLANEQQRLNGVFAVGKDRAVEQIAINQELAVTEEKVISIDEEVIAATTAKTTTLDLFTEAQLANIAATEKLIEVENGLLFSEGSLFRGFGYGEGNATSSGVNKFKSVAEDERLALEAQGLALRGNLTLQEAHTAQASLFSKAEMEATIATGKYNDELTLQNALLAENAEVGRIASANQNILNPYAGTSGKIIGSLSSAVMSVFIAGMAIEVADQLFPHGQVTKTGLTWRDWVSGASTVLSPASWFDSHTANSGIGFGKVHDIAVENAKAEILQNSLNRQSSDLTKHLAPSGNFLYGLLSKSALFNEIDPQDKFGKRQQSNEQVYDLLKKFGFEVPYILDLIEHDEKKQIKVNAGKVPETPKHQLRGNSSNYFTVHIDTMNGINKLEVKEASESQIQNLKQTVGIEVDRMMQEVINDIQVVRTGH